ncbi:hypothetical protein [Nocardia carnea]|uniref:hypothetical protein n=1 Tax=Nocardia carnea TaxID=37328 RepID=UPI00245691EC|nr:hypothetical protein [Nocardia carnea]
MAVRYPKSQQKKYLAEVQDRLNEGHSLNSACSSVSARHNGLPIKNTLANWAKAAQLSAHTAPSAAAPQEPETEKAATATVDKPDALDAAQPTEIQTSPPDESRTHPAEPVPNEPTEAAQIPTFIGAELHNGQHVAALIHVSDPAFENAIDENRRLRRELEEANREIRAMRDLVVVYASR